MSERSLDLLGELFLAAMEERPPHAYAREWLVRGILAVIRDGRCLDEALGLVGSGINLPASVLARLRRDELLVRAGAALCADPTISPWERAQRLVPEVRAVSRMRHHLRALEAPLSHWSQCRQLLWRAYAAGLPMPSSESALYRILDAYDQRSVHVRSAVALARFR